MKNRNRKSTRLKGYNYTFPGAYFVTLVTFEREPFFGMVTDGIVVLNPVGEIARKEWQRLCSRFGFIQLDEYVIMPNYVHGIIVIQDLREIPSGEDGIDVQGAASDAGHGRPEGNLLHPYENDQPINVITGSLGAIVRAYKSSVTRHINLTRYKRDVPIWQKNYYDHIIRDEKDLSRIREYILVNPTNWAQDDENLERKTG